MKLTSLSTAVQQLARWLRKMLQSWLPPITNWCGFFSPPRMKGLAVKEMTTAHQVWVVELAHLLREIDPVDQEQASQRACSLLGVSSEQFSHWRRGVRLETKDVIRLFGLRRALRPVRGGNGHQQKGAEIVSYLGVHDDLLGVKPVELIGTNRENELVLAIEARFG